MAQKAGTTNYLGSTPSQRHVIDQEQALIVINGAAKESAAIGIPVNIAITDPSGLLVAFLRTDNAFPASVDIAQKKARTVSLFNGAFTTAALYDTTQPGQSLFAIEQTNGGVRTLQRTSGHSRWRVEFVLHCGPSIYRMLLHNLPHFTNRCFQLT